MVQCVAAQEQGDALEAARGQVGSLEGRAAEAAEQAAALSRERGDLQATLTALQKTLGAEDPKVWQQSSRLAVRTAAHVTIYNLDACRWKHVDHSATGCLRAGMGWATSDGDVMRVAAGGLAGAPRGRRPTSRIIGPEQTIF